MAQQRLTVAFVDNVLDPHKPGRSGLSDIVWDLGEALTNHGVEVHIVASYHSNNFPSDKVIVHNFSTPVAGYRNLLGRALLLKRAATIIKSLQPNVIHVPEYFSTWIFWLLGVRIPLVLTVPGNIYYRQSIGRRYVGEWYVAQILKLAARSSAKHCARIIATSQEMRYWWTKIGSSRDHTPVIPLGVNHRRFRYVAGAKDYLQVPHDQLMFLYVGRLSVEKGVEDIVKAAISAVDDLRGRAMIFLVGSGALRNNLAAQVSAAKLDDVVIFRDWVDQDDLPIWYSAADVVLLPSRSEAFGRAMVEAMMCGTPVLATNLGGARDVLEPNRTGFLIEPGDVKGLAALLSWLARHPQSAFQMRATVGRIANDLLSWDSIGAKIVNMVYRPLLDELQQRR